MLKKSIYALGISLVFLSNSTNATNFIYNVNGSFNYEKISKKVSQSGGELLSCIQQIGVCQVKFNSIQAAQDSNLDVVPDATAMLPQLPAEATGTALEVKMESFSNPPNSNDDDFFFDLQWGHTAVGAADAWNKGIRGQGVRIAVLDSGADADHPDLAPNINTILSRSFVAGETWDQTMGTFNHGSHTAGTIAAADNGFGTIGVAPEAELIILKVLSAETGSGSSYGTMAAIVYAADNDVDVVNMSLGLSIRRNGYYDVEGTPYDTSDDIRFEVGGKDGIAQFINTYSKATSYARTKGVTLIASAGNENTDYDHSDSLVHLPSSLPSVMSISATSPILWGIDPYTNLDTRAGYSNYGQSEISFAAPGGFYAGAFLPEGFNSCTVGGVTRSCYVFDYVFSTSGTGSWYWSVGTSMASPHAAGIAALIISANGGKMTPSQVKTEMMRLATDLGKPGNDDVYGLGRVKAP